jgi:flavodoxin
MMKVCIAYESKYGNGKKCMEYLQSVMSKKGHNVEMFSIHEKKPTSAPSANLYVFSSPTQIGGPAGKMKKFLKKNANSARRGKICSCNNLYESSKYEKS